MEISQCSPTLPETFSPEPFEIEGADSGPLRLDYYAAPDREPRDQRSAGPPRPPVIICHGFRGYKDWGFIPLLASRLAESGIPAFAFSTSGSGIRDRDGAFVEPQRFRKNTYGREMADLGIVVGWALERLARNAAGPPRAGLVGHSRGGTLSLLYAVSDSRIGCVATLGAQSQLGIWEPDQVAAWERGDDVSIHDFRTRTRLSVAPDLWNDFKKNRSRYDVARAVESLAIPLLIAHGDRDKVVSLEHARRIAAHASQATTELRIIEGAGHMFQAGDKIRRTPPQLLDMVEAVTAWMRRWLNA